MSANDNRPSEHGALVPPPQVEGEVTPALDDPRVVAALEQFLAAIEAGDKPNRPAFLARHAEIAGPLAECLDGMEALHVAVASAPSNFPPTQEEMDWGPGDDEVGGEGKFLEGRPGTPLGDFRILREIGRGGMGVVYEAVQLSLNRRVALKVLPFAAALDAKKLQRFKNEAQAAAYLHHTNIVPVYAVGAERGVHFYAMQLIEGQSLAALIEDLRRQVGPGEFSDARSWPEAAPTGPYPPPAPKETRGRTTSPPLAAIVPTADTPPSLGAQLSTQRAERAAVYFRTLARLAAQAAEGLDYAHGLGIIHRDVKPANLLIDDRGTIWVTDFGLAQFHADAGLTQTGDLLGTLRYMSPEQAGGLRGLIDHRTDVYSLGATLYELLTLRPIFDGADRQTLLRQIMDDDPRLPRSIDRSIPAELETIVLKALGKLPAERYATARELADDLQRFLEDRPIRARRPSFFEKATKWARRHRAVVGSAVVVLLLTVAGLSAATVLIAGAYDRERQKAHEAEESFRQARRAVDQLVQISGEELAGRFNMEATRKRLLEAALVYYQDFIDQRSDNPSIREELKESRDQVETIIGELTTLMSANRYLLLQQSPVQEELQLTKDQRREAGQITEHFNKSAREIRRPGPEGDQRRLLLAREQEAAVAKLLTPEQLQRFKQIVRQYRGPAAFRDPEVVSALKLLPEQRQRIRGIEAAMYPLKPDYRRSGESPMGPPHKTFDDMRKTATEQVQAVLTVEQVKRWRELTGKPFAGPFLPFYFHGSRERERGLGKSGPG